MTAGPAFDAEASRANPPPNREQIAPRLRSYSCRNVLDIETNL